MHVGTESSGITMDETKYVQYKHYTLSHFKLWKTCNVGCGFGYDEIVGFEATWSPPAHFVGWPDETLTFGVTGTSSGDLYFSEDITEVGIRIDTGTFYDHRDFEWITFKTSSGATQGIGSEDGSASWDTLPGNLIGFHTRYGYYI